MYFIYGCNAELGLIMSIKRNELMQYLNALMQPEKCKDYCHSGNYKIYIENTKRILREKFPESDIRF